MDHIAVIYSDYDGFLRDSVTSHIPSKGSEVSFPDGKYTRRFKVTKVRYTYRDVSLSASECNTVVLDRVYVTIRPLTDIEKAI